MSVLTPTFNNPPPDSLLDSLEQLRVAIGKGDANELVGLFISDGQAALSGFDNADRLGDEAALKHSAADLLGLSSLMGARTLAELSRDLYRDAPDRGARRRRIAAIQQEWNRVEWLLSLWTRVEPMDSRSVA